MALTSHLLDPDWLRHDFGADCVGQFEVSVWTGHQWEELSEMTGDRSDPADRGRLSVCVHAPSCSCVRVQPGVSDRLSL